MPVNVASKKHWAPLIRLLLAPLILAALVSSCTSPNSIQGRVMVVDGYGYPVQGAVLAALDENGNDTPHAFDEYEIRARSSDAHGIFHVDLEDCFWPSDGSYHFRIQKDGFDDVEMSVSRDLFPPMLRVDLKARAPGAAPPTRGGHA
jgi:hypothetical protein